MDSQGGHVMTIANSIIGVSILAMPYCFKQCGLVLSSLMLILSSIISRMSCHFLLKSSLIAKHKSIESLAFFTFGSCGKLTIELGIIGFLLGTCIAFFVVMGDLGPQIIADMAGVPATDTLRTTVLIFLAVFCILPLGLLRQVDSLTVVCTAAIGFYMCLVLKIMAESAPHLMYEDWYNHVYFWRTEGILQCLPIFSMALFCQTQLFEIYQAIPNANPDRMNNLIRMAVNICTCVYIFVGTFGYIAVCDKPFSGNILLSFKSSLMTEIIKIGFVMSVAVSFPLIIFPCRASLFSMTYAQTYKSLEYGRSYIPDANFRYLTIGIISISLLIGVLVPNIELVLGLVGSTIGVLICVLFPATSFICLSKKNTNERILAQVMIFIGILVMVLGTYANLNVAVDTSSKTVVEKVKVIDPMKNIDKNPVIPMGTTAKLIPHLNSAEKNNNLIMQPDISNEVIHETRHEPPQPVEPEPEPIKDVISPQEEKVQVQIENQPEKSKPESIHTTKKMIPNKAPEDLSKLRESPKSSNVNDVDSAELDSEAIKKEEKEIKLQQEESIINEEKAELHKLKKQTEELLEKIDSEKDGKEKLAKESIISEKKDELDQLQRKTEELLQKQQEILVEIKESAKGDMVLEEMKALKSIKEIEHIAKSAIVHIEQLVERDKNTDRSILKEIVEPKRLVNEVKPELPKTAVPISINNNTEIKRKISSVPENFVPIPIAKSNLSMYNMDINKEITYKKPAVEMSTVVPKSEAVSIENKVAIENQVVVQDNSIIKGTDPEQPEVAKEVEKLETNINSDKQKEALDSVRRDILSVNASRT